MYKPGHKGKSALYAIPGLCPIKESNRRYGREEMVQVSNEELVAAIQAGDQNRMGELWEQTERFIAWKARRVMTTLESNSTVEVDDLIQSGYFALVAAVRTYKPGDMVFVKWLSFYLQTAFAEVAGYRTVKMRNDPCRWATSLDMPMGEDGDTTISEIIPDVEATATMEAVEESLWREQLKRVEAELISGLHKDQREVVNRHYFGGQTYEECAAAMGISLGKVRTLMANGMKELRRPHNAEQLLPFFVFDFFKGTGLQAYRNSGMSIQEKYLIKKETVGKRNCFQRKSIDDIRFQVAGL